MLTRVFIVLLIVAGLGLSAWMTRLPDTGAAPAETPSAPALPDMPDDRSLNRAVFTDIAQSAAGLVAVGEAGSIRLSTDQGLSWQPVASGTDALLNAVEFVSPESGWAVGDRGTLLRTGDGGKSWQPVLSGLEGTEDITWFDVAFLGNGTGFVVGTLGRTLTTRDGGESWQLELLIPGYNSASLYAVAALGEKSAMVVGERGRILRYQEDEGWQDIYSPAYGALHGILPLAESGGVLVFGENGGVYQSDDLGENWRQLATVSRANYHAGAQLEDGSVLLAGSSGVLVRRQPGGQRFYLETGHPAGALLAVRQVKDQALVVAGEQGLGRSSAQGFRFGTEPHRASGRFVIKQLLDHPDSKRLLELAAKDDDTSYRWVSLDMTMPESAAGDEDLTSRDAVLSITRFLMAAEEAVPGARLEAYSPWTSDHALAVTGKHQGTWENWRLMSGAESEYGRKERENFRWKLRRSALVGGQMAPDFRTARAEVRLIPWSYETDQEQKEHQAMLVEALPGLVQELAGVDLVRVRQMQWQRVSVPTSTEPPSQSGQGGRWAWALTVDDPDSYYCRDTDNLQLSQHLEARVREVPGVQATLAVAEQAKIDQLKDLEGVWKGFVAVEAGYPSRAMEAWQPSSCRHVMLLAFGEPAGSDLTSALTQATEGMADDRVLQWAAYRLSETAVVLPE